MARLKRFVKSLTTIFQALKYENVEKGSESLPDIRGKERGVQRKHQVLNRKLSASDGNLHRNKRDAVAAFPKQSQSFAKQKSVSDVPKVVAHVIEEASSAAALLNQSPLMAREPIRVINGARPSLQSQVLLNTRTSQPFEDLVKDLALSVRVPKQPIGNCLKTLAGRHIRGYSQLRSELKAGQRAFFIYSDTKPVVAASTLNPNSINQPKQLNQNGKPIVKRALGKVNSNSSSNLSDVDGEMKDKRKAQNQRRRRSHSPTPSLRTSSRHTNSRSPSPYTNYKN